MTFTTEQKTALEAPLSKSHVKKNPRGFDYVEAWQVIAEANRIFGFDAWDRETVLLTETNRELVELSGSNGPYKQWRVGYLAKVRIRVGDVTREGTGFGSGMGKPEALGDAIESAAKEAESDAMKRALMTFGNPFGLALYDKEKANVTNAPPAPAAPSEPETPPEESAAVLAANLAISICKTSAELKAWWEEHKAQINALPDPQYVLVSATMRAKTAELKPKAVSNG